MSTGTLSHSAAHLRSRNARASIGVSSISDSYIHAAEADPVVGEQRCAHRCYARESLSSLSRKLKNVMGADRNRCQSTEVNEALEWTGYFFNDEQPLGDLVKHNIVECSLRLPGNEFVSGVVTQERRTGQVLRTGARDFWSGGVSRRIHSGNAPKPSRY